MKASSHIGDIESYVAEEAGQIITGTQQDCTPYLEDAKKRHNEGLHGSKEMRLAASFPEVLVERYCHENGVDFREFMTNPAHMRRMLADPDLSGFRIWPGKVG